MPVEFSVSPADLHSATQQFAANRGKYMDTDFAEIRVFQTVAILHTVGSECELPVDGREPGLIRVPLKILEKISDLASTLEKSPVAFVFEPGLVKVESVSVKHPEIDLRQSSTAHLSLPVDISLLDTLALTKILSSKAIEGEGMRARVDEAHNVRRSAIAGALSALQLLGIQEWQVNHFVDTHISEAAQRLKVNIGVL